MKKPTKIIKILWVDREHMKIWSGGLELLDKHVFEFTYLSSLRHNEVIDNCSGKDEVVIHPGTRNPIATLRGLLESIKKQYPCIKIGLMAACKHPAVEDLVDFYVDFTLPISDMGKLLRSEAR